eukprot:g20951.t1
MLRTLNLTGNQLEGLIPPTLGELKSLKVLTAEGNRLSGEIPASLGLLVQLGELNLSKNNLSGAIPKTLTRLVNLKEFKIRGNPELTLPERAHYCQDRFYEWMHKPDLATDLADVQRYQPVATGSQGSPQPFPEGTKDQHILLEAPISKDSDYLEFGQYAEVLTNRITNPTAWPVGVGIYAQWGAGKSSLVQLILGKLRKEHEKPSAGPCLVRWLWSTSGGAVLYALVAGLVSAIFCRCWDPSEQTTPPKTPPANQPGNVEEGLKPHVHVIIACFDAWLFADSEALWAVLIKEIFTQVENYPSFGKGAVRATRVQHAVTSSTCSDWTFAILTAFVVAAVVAVVGWAGGQIADMEEQLGQVAAATGLAAVPITVLLWIVKKLAVVFQGQGDIILSKAKSMGESVGAANLGFMAQVQGELQVLLGMLKKKSKGTEKYMLVVSIDNLDRCPPRQIVKVLEAVHLLLEKDKVNVAVILALDPRIIIAAIEDSMEQGMRREVSGAEYLDKIIHWPFCIPYGTETERLDLLQSWLGGRGEPSPGGSDGPGRGSSHDAEEPPPGDSDSRTTDHSESARDTKNAGARDIVTPSEVHIREEIDELQEMIKAVTNTPRKAKRVCNIYSIQRELARKMMNNFNRDSARKLLRWTILSEFWPFHTACLVAVARTTHKNKETLENMYMDMGAKFLRETLDSDRVGTEARRLMGFEEADDEFLRILSLPPQLLVEDFHEDRLMLLRLSFNLNPATVARVMRWKRSHW